MSTDLACDAGPGGSVLLTLAAPERRNSLRTSTVEVLTRVLQTEPHRTVVIRSSTPGIFCAGVDLKISDSERARLSDDLYALYELMVTRPGAVLALVDGPAVGGGAQLATAADIRIVTRRARFRWVGPAHGLAVGAWILPALVGRTAALELTMTSRWLEAEEAARLGLATAVSNDPDSDLAATLTALSLGQPEAVARVKSVALGTSLDRLREERAANRSTWNGRAEPTRASSCEKE